MAANSNQRPRDGEKRKMDWGKLLEQYKWPIGVGMVGLALVTAGLTRYFFLSQEETLVEIIPAEEETTETVWVDIEGAVEKPGVYELTSGSRVNDILVRAGGLSADADRGWVEKNINRAQRLTDGVKIYVPRQDEVGQMASSGSGTGSVAGSAMTTKININLASSSELDSLWGIGEKRAAEIVANRPYQTVEELKTKKIIPSNVYERIKDQISCF